MRRAAVLPLILLGLLTKRCDAALFGITAPAPTPRRSSIISTATTAAAARFRVIVADESASTPSASEDATAAATATASWRRDSPPETVVPSVSLTRSRDRTTGTATFRFDRPSVLSLHDVWDNGLITGLWLRDDEGELVSDDLQLEFVGGKPEVLKAILVLKSASEWERFMRFMRRYAAANQLSFESAGGEG